MIFLLWIIGFATFVTLFVLWSVTHFVPREQSENLDDYLLKDISFFKKQEAEIAHDLKIGLIDEDSAKEAKLELARNLLAKKKHSLKNELKNQRTKAMRVVLTLAVFMLPIMVFGVYFLIGSPNVASHPFYLLMDKLDEERNSAENLVVMEALFMREPDNGSLADKLATSYLVAGQFQDAANRYIDAMRLNGESAPRFVGYGLALTSLNGGVITKDAENAFRKAAQIAPEDFYPRLFIARALQQAGETQKAISGLEEFLQNNLENKQDNSKKNSLGREKVENLIKQLENSLKNNVSDISDHD